MAKKKARQNTSQQRRSFSDFIIAHRKIFMPAVLIICVLLTVLLALHFNRTQENAELTDTSLDASSGEDDTMTLSQNAQINELISRYFTAAANGDMETLDTVAHDLTGTERLLLQELSRYIERYDVQEVWLKPGPEENSYIAFVVEQYKLFDHEKSVPSMESFLIRQAEDESYYIYAGILDDEQNLFIRSSNLTSDVIDLSNKVNAEYNSLMESDPTLEELMSTVYQSVNDKVAEALAEEANENAQQQPQDEPGEEDEPSAETTDGSIALGTHTVNTEGVRLRKESNTQSVVLTEMNKGTSVEVIETVEGETIDGANKWCKVKYNGFEGYILASLID